MTEEFLRRPQVLKAAGFSSTTLYRLIAAGTFPKAVRLGENSVGWLKSEVDAWQAKKIATRDAA